MFFTPILFESSLEFIIGWICGFVNKRLIDDTGTTAYKTSLHTGYFQQGLAWTARAHNVQHDVAGMSH
jgi:hypothetical protein